MAEPPEELLANLGRVMIHAAHLETTRDTFLFSGAAARASVAVIHSRRSGFFSLSGLCCAATWPMLSASWMKRRPY